jgi:tetratricopeptide (TPR) repeat protein
MGGLAGVHRAVGEMFAFLGLPSAAAQAFGEALAVEPDPETYLRLGDALAVARRWHEGASAFAAAVRIRPCSLAAHGGLALCLARAGRPLECIAALEAFARQRPLEAEPHLLRGGLLLRLGRRAEALQAMRWAAQLPGPPASRRFLLAEELFGTRAWEALLDRHRSARLLVGTRPTASRDPGRSALNAAPAPMPEARPMRRPRRARRSLRLGRWSRRVAALACVPEAWLRAGARGLLILAARALASSRPHVAIRSFRAASDLAPSRRPT